MSASNELHDMRKRSSQIDETIHENDVPDTDESWSSDSIDDMEIEVDKEQPNSGIEGSFMNTDEFDSNEGTDETETDSDDSEQEVEVEEHEFHIPGSENGPVIIRLRKTQYPETSRWTSTIRAACILDGVVVGYARGELIWRDFIRANFWTRLQIVSLEVKHIFALIFDRYGLLKTQFLEHPIQRGTGVWGHDLDHGPLFYIEEIYVSQSTLRSKGLGRKVLFLLLQKAKATVEDRKPEYNRLFHGAQGRFEESWTLKALSVPGMLAAYLAPQLEDKSAIERRMIRIKANDSAVAFHRACGFRRIGSSICFGFSFDEKHRSRLLAPEEDCNPPLPPVEDLDDQDVAFHERGILKGQRMQQMLKDQPLHYAAISLSDIECMEHLKDELKKGADWGGRDSHWNTLLHLTAKHVNPQSTAWLLENVPEAQNWRLSRNIDGLTPLEVLQEELEEKRTKAQGLCGFIDISDRFAGFKDDAVMCQHALLRSVESPTTPSTVEAARLKFGCTCGECLGGFISPRMSFSLAGNADYNFDNMSEWVKDRDRWVEHHDDIMEHLTTGARRNLETSESARQGFATIFQVIAYCLNSDLMPSAGNISDLIMHREEWASARGFAGIPDLIQGIEVALRHLISLTESEDLLVGDGDDALVWEEELEKLRSCRNDREYGAVMEALELRPEPANSW